MDDLEVLKHERRSHAGRLLKSWPLVLGVWRALLGSARCSKEFTGSAAKIMFADAVARIGTDEFT